MPSFEYVEYVEMKKKQEKKKVAHATIEEILYDVCDYDDMDSSLMLNVDGEGGVYVGSYEGEFSIAAPTLKEALIKFGKHFRSRYGEEYYRFDNLDWGDCYG